MSPGPRVATVEYELVQPEVPIHPDASAIHGITLETLEADPGTLTQERAADVVMRAIQGANRAGVPIVGMNLSFDLTLLDRLSRRYEVLRDPWYTDAWGGPQYGFAPGTVHPVIDVYVIDRYVDPYRRGSRKLPALCQHYGVSHNGAHDAQEDVLATCRVLWKIGRLSQAAHTDIHRWYEQRRDSYSPGRRSSVPWLTQMSALKELARLDLDQLHRAQIQWAWEQRVGLQRHFRKTDPAARVDPRWPFIPAPEEDIGNAEDPAVDARPQRPLRLGEQVDE
jgi:DNA polymerase-3 subunit epsilon